MSCYVVTFEHFTTKLESQHLDIKMCYPHTIVWSWIQDFLYTGWKKTAISINLVWFPLVAYTENSTVKREGTLDGDKPGKLSCTLVIGVEPQ